MRVLSILLLASAAFGAALAADAPYDQLLDGLRRLEDNRSAMLSLAAAIQSTPRRDFVEREMLFAAVRRTCDQRSELLIQVEHSLIDIAIHPPAPAIRGKIDALLGEFRRQLEDSVRILERSRKSKEPTDLLNLMRASEISAITRFSGIEAAEMNQQYRTALTIERPRIHTILAVLRRHEADCYRWADALHFAEDVYHQAARDAVKRTSAEMTR